MHSSPPAVAQDWRSSACCHWPTSRAPAHRRQHPAVRHCRAGDSARPGQPGARDPGLPGRKPPDPSARGPSGDLRRHRLARLPCRRRARRGAGRSRRHGRAHRGRHPAGRPYGHPGGGVMSTRTASVDAAPVRRSSPAFSTWATALLLPLGPAAVAGLRLVLPYYTAGSAAGDRRRSRESPWHAVGSPVARTHRCAHPGARRDRSGEPVPRRGPSTYRVGPGAGRSGLSRAGGHDRHGPAPVERTGVRSVSHPGRGALLRPHPTIGIATGIFVVGHVVGTVLLGIALVRSGRVPAWPAGRSPSRSPCTSSPPSSSEAPRSTSWAGP